MDVNINMENEPIYMILHQLVHLSKYQAFQHLEEFNLKPGQAGILFVLSGNGKLSQRELAAKIGITPPSMTVALRKMEELEYVGKEPDERDQRIVRIFLKEKGKKCVKEIKDVMERMEEVLYLGVSQEEKMLLRRLLFQMRHNLLESKYFKGVNMRMIMERTCPPVHEGF